MNFFSKCKNQEDAKLIYKKLSRNFHPDKGGDNDLMIELNKQYEEFNPFRSSSYQNTQTFTFDSSNQNALHRKIQYLDNMIVTLQSSLEKRIEQYDECSNELMKLKNMDFFERFLFLIFRVT